MERVEKSKFLPQNGFNGETEFVIEQEGISRYRLEDGTVLIARLICTKITRDGHNTDGTPRYLVSWQQIMDGRYPEHLMKKDT